MFSLFKCFFNETCECKEGKNPFSVFMKTFEGKQFNSGMFNVFLIADLPKWSEYVENVFEEFKGAIQLFGYDWLGRCFAVDLRKSTYGQIIMLDPTSLEAYQIPCGFMGFVNEEIPQNHEICLASDFFNEWSDACGCKIPINCCVGYTVPLYLNGEDSFDNLDITDMEVYWDITAQLKCAIRHLEEGQTIDDIIIE